MGMRVGSKTPQALLTELKRLKPGLNLAEIACIDTWLQDAEDSDIEEQLELRDITAGGNPRPQLKARLLKEQELEQREHNAKYSMNLDVYCLLRNPKSRAVDRLHLEMRTGERLWWLLFNYPLMKSSLQMHPRNRASESLQEIK